ncbi:MAG TPA: ABC transporter permease [Candidatus Binatia bacterium]|nr:ABC transporter permease [Candidatus Binatia bacterium]
MNVQAVVTAPPPRLSLPVRGGPLGWLRSYGLMLRFDLSSYRQWLPMVVALQILMGAAMAIIYGLYVPHLPRTGLLYIVSGAPALALLPLGLILVPSLISSQRTAGTFDFIWSLPVSRAAQVASSLTITTLIALPGIVVTLVLATWRYGVPLSVSPMVVPAFLLTALMAASVGTALAHLVANPVVINLITNILVFVVLLFSPIAFPLSQFPTWLADIHEGLPLYHMAVVIRASLTTGLVSGVATSYLVLGAWTLAGWIAVAWVTGRRG